VCRATDMSTSWVLPLRAPAVTLAHAGGKGVNLGVMLRAGLPVPAGFVVTTDSYRAFVAANALAPLIETQWQRIVSGDPAALDAASSILRTAFAEASAPSEVAAAISSAYHDLGRAMPVAVRSSATAEDLPDASFAGQQDTYLNVIGESALLDAVKHCWGSLWTARAMAYRVRRGIAPDQVSLAVVVQKMVAADAAGVMFTVNPLTGARDEVVINAAWGLGEALVAGRVTPDTITVDKATGRIKQVEIGEKLVMTAVTDGGVAEVAVDEARRNEAALQPAHVSALAALGVTLEELFGAAQDVEWVVAQGELVLLQSRPVTSVAAPVAPPGDDAWPELADLPAQPFDFWTQQDLGERWPDPVTPLTWSISEPMTQQSMERMLAGLKAPYAGKIRWCKRAFGHVYLNEGALLHAYTDGFGMPMQLLESGLTHPGARPADAERWQPGKVLRHLPVYWEVATGWQRNAVPPINTGSHNRRLMRSTPRARPCPPRRAAAMFLLALLPALAW